MLIHYFLPSCSFTILIIPFTRFFTSCSSLLSSLYPSRHLHALQGSLPGDTSAYLQLRHSGKGYNSAMRYSYSSFFISSFLPPPFPLPHQPLLRVVVPAYPRKVSGVDTLVRCVHHIQLRLDGIHLLGSERGWGGDIHRKPLLGA